MKFAEYEAKRNELINNAQSLIDEGKIEDATSIMKDVEALDERYDAEAKAEADLRAISGAQRKINMQNLAGVQVDGKAVESTEKVDASEAYKTDAYATAWSKKMMNAKMDKEDAKVYSMVNEAYTHTTENTGDVVPDVVAKGIWREVEDKFPFYADTFKTFINGNAIMIVEKSSTPAKWYEESTPTEDGKELFDKFELKGCELARSITVSWKLKEMAVEDFIPYIIDRMAQAMGKALAYGVTHGEGTDAEDGAEPIGIVYALTEESGTPQVIEYSTLTFANLASARGKVKSGYTPAVYCNSATLWGTLASLVDGNGRPLLMADAINGGVYRILGCVVKEDDAFADGEILFSDAKQYQVNINKQITMGTEEHTKARTTDYCAYAIADGAPITTKAHALLKKA